MEQATTLTNMTTTMTTGLEEEFRALLLEQEKLIQDTHEAMADNRRLSKQPQPQQTQEHEEQEPRHHEQPQSPSNGESNHENVIGEKDHSMRKRGPDTKLYLDDHDSVSPYDGCGDDEEKKDEYEHEASENVDAQDYQTAAAAAMEDDELRSFVDSVNDVSDILNAVIKNIPPSCIHIVNETRERQHKAQRQRMVIQINTDGGADATLSLGGYLSKFDDELKESNAAASSNIDDEEVSLPSLWQGDTSVREDHTEGTKGTDKPSTIFRQSRGGRDSQTITSPGEDGDINNMCSSPANGFVGDNLTPDVWKEDYSSSEATKGSMSRGTGTSKMISSPPRAYGSPYHRSDKPPPSPRQDHRHGTIPISPPRNCELPPPPPPPRPYLRTPSSPSRDGCNVGDDATTLPRSGASNRIQRRGNSRGGRTAVYPSPSNSFDCGEASEADEEASLSPPSDDDSTSAVLEHEREASGGGMIILPSTCNSWCESNEPVPTSTGMATSSRSSLVPDVWYDAAAETLASPIIAEDNVLSILSGDDEDRKEDKVDEKELSSVLAKDMFTLQSPCRDGEQDSIALPAKTDDDEKEVFYSPCEEKVNDTEEKASSIDEMHASDSMVLPTLDCTSGGEGLGTLDDVEDENEEINSDPDSEQNSCDCDDMTPVRKGDIDDYEEDTVSVISSAVQGALTYSSKLRPTATATLSETPPINKPRGGKEKVLSRSDPVGDNVNATASYVDTSKLQGSLKAPDSSSGAATPQLSNKETAISSKQLMAAVGLQAETNKPVRNPLAAIPRQVDMPTSGASESAGPASTPGETISSIYSHEPFFHINKSKKKTPQKNRSRPHKPSFDHRNNVIFHQGRPSSIDEIVDMTVYSRVHERPSSLARRLFVMASCLEDTPEEMVENYKSGLALGRSDSEELLSGNQQEAPEDLPSDSEFEYDYAYTFGDESQALTLSSRKSNMLPGFGAEQTPTETMGDDTDDDGALEDVDYETDDPDDDGDEDSFTDFEFEHTDCEYEHTDSEFNGDDTCSYDADESKAGTSLLSNGRSSRMLSKFEGHQLANESMDDDDTDDEGEDSESGVDDSTRDDSCSDCSSHEEKEEEEYADESVIDSPKKKAQLEFEENLINSLLSGADVEVIDSPKKVGTDKNYYDRSLWRQSTHGGDYTDRSYTSIDDEMLNHRTIPSKPFLSQLVESFTSGAVCCSAPEESPDLARLSSSMDSMVSPSVAYSDAEL